MSLSTLLSRLLVAFTIELDNEFEHRFARAGGGARVASVAMWSNFLRFVGDAITVGELPAVSGTPKARALSTLGGMERWRYVYVAQSSAHGPPPEKRDGYGSARGLDSNWVVRPTSAGRTAAAIWPLLFDEVEGRCGDRFGARAVDELRSSLRAIVGQIDDAGLPEHLPILGSANGMALDLPSLERREPPRDQHLLALLSRALAAYTLDFERESELSLPIRANVIRVLDEPGVLVRDLPRLSGISKEAVSMALTVLGKTEHVVVEGKTVSTKRVSLTPSGRRLQAAYDRLHAEIEREWDRRFGGVVRRLRSGLEGLCDDGARLARGLEPYPDGWRASKQYLASTQAVLADPLSALPHYPMVLHRGGWPDGS